MGQHFLVCNAHSIRLDRCHWVGASRRRSSLTRVTADNPGHASPSLWWLSWQHPAVLLSVQVLKCAACEVLHAWLPGRRVGGRQAECLMADNSLDVLNQVVDTMCPLDSVAGLAARHCVCDAVSFLIHHPVNAV
jgi:hypothetical protein